MNVLSKLSIIINEKEIINANLDIANHPKTVNELLRAGKVKALTIKRGSYYMFRIPVRVGAEKPESFFKEGDIAFDYMGGWLLIFIKSGSYFGKANFIGKIESKMPEIKPGTELILVFLP
ncbi:MAG: hypothetical protein ACP5LF_06155 [Nitrososphaeria archaeon]